MTRTERTFYLLFGSYSLAQFFLAPVYPLFLLSRGLDLLEINLILAIYLITIFVFEVPTGALADTAGRRSPGHRPPICSPSSTRRTRSNCRARVSVRARILRSIRRISSSSFEARTAQRSWWARSGAAILPSATSAIRGWRPRPCSRRRALPAPS